MNDDARLTMSPAGTAHVTLARAVLAAMSVAATTVPFIAIDPFPAGDVNSHVYNAWLTRLARVGSLPGLSLHARWTNAVADVALEHMVAHLPTRFVITVVLVVTAQLFLWSSFLFCRSLTQRSCWEWLPLLACVSIGWTFHVGLTNWYLSASLSLLASSILLRTRAGVSRGAMAGIGLCAAACANPLPPAWCVTAMSIVAVLRRYRTPGILLVLVLVVLAAAGRAAAWAGRARFTPGKLLAWTGADQLWVFDGKYAVFMLVVIGLWTACARAWLRSAENDACAHPAFIVAVFASGCCLLLPDIAWFPGYESGASLLTQRASVFAAVGWTSVAALGVSPSAIRRVAIATSVTAASWTFSMAHEWTNLSRAASDVAEIMITLPPGTRVVQALASPPSRVPAFSHVLERACIGRCFAWGNYEAPSKAFRLRAARRNTFVVASADDYTAIEAGTYRVPAVPFPLWKISACPSSGRTMRLCASAATAGELVALDCVDPFWTPWARRDEPSCPRLQYARVGVKVSPAIRSVRR